MILQISFRNHQIEDRYNVSGKMLSNLSSHIAYLNNNLIGNYYNVTLILGTPLLKLAGMLNGIDASLFVYDGCTLKDTEIIELLALFRQYFSSEDTTTLD